MGLFGRLFGAEKTPKFDVQEEAKRLLKELPPCTAFVVIASPRYSGSYRAEVIAEAGKLASFFETLSKSSFGGSQSDQVARMAMPIWLRTGTRHVETAPSYLPASFFNRVKDYVQDFVNRGEAAVHCPDCNAVVSGVKMNRRNEHRNIQHSEWTSEWRCPANHLLYTEDDEIEWMRRSATEVSPPGLFKKCSELASDATIEVTLTEGFFSSFLIKLSVPGEEFTKIIQDRDALQKFINIIELRIKHRDFDDPYAKTNYANLGLHEPQKNMDAPRILLDQNEKPLANWAPEKE